MAQTTLPVFSHPNFHSVLDAVLNQEIARVDRILAQAEAETCAETCDYQEPESSVGACDGGFSCSEPALENGFCRKHQEAARG